MFNIFNLDTNSLATRVTSAIGSIFANYYEEFVQ